MCTHTHSALRIHGARQQDLRFARLRGAVVLGVKALIYIYIYMYIHTSIVWNPTRRESYFEGMQSNFWFHLLKPFDFLSGFFIYLFSTLRRPVVLFHWCPWICAYKLSRAVRREQYNN